MLCPICKKENATLEVIRFVGDKTVTGLVCERCYSIAVNLDTKGFYFYFEALKNKKCGVCGRTYKQFSETLLLGCPSCYNEFSAELKPLIDSIQK